MTEDLKIQPVTNVTALHRFQKNLFQAEAHPPPIALDYLHLQGLIESELTQVTPQQRQQILNLQHIKNHYSRLASTHARSDPLDKQILSHLKLPNEFSFTGPSTLLSFTDLLKDPQLHAQLDFDTPHDSSSLSPLPPLSSSHTTNSHQLNNLHILEQLAPTTTTTDNHFTMNTKTPLTTIPKTEPSYDTDLSFQTHHNMLNNKTVSNSNNNLPPPPNNNTTGFQGRGMFNQQRPTSQSNVPPQQPAPPTSPPQPPVHVPTSTVTSTTTTTTSGGGGFRPINSLKKGGVFPRVPQKPQDSDEEDDNQPLPPPHAPAPAHLRKNSSSTAPPSSSSSNSNGADDDNEDDDGDGKKEFMSARDKLMIDVKNNKAKPPPAKRPALGTKSLAAKRKGFNNPYKKEEEPPQPAKKRKEEGGDKAAILEDERLKNFEPELVERVLSEIVDNGPGVSWEDIVGLDYAKRSVYEAVIWPMLRPDIFQGILSPPCGILLFGPPGTGKTMIGKAIASQSKSTFFSISASSLTSKWV